MQIRSPKAFTREGWSSIKRLQNSDGTKTL